MKDLVLFYAKTFASDFLLRKHLMNELFSLAIYPQITLALKESDSLLNTLVWAYEADWQRMIAFCDDECFARLNSALATTLGLDLELSCDEPIVSGASWLAKSAINFSADNKEFFIIKLSETKLSDELKSALFHSTSSGAWLLNIDALSAEILLNPAASANYLSCDVSELYSGLCAISLRTNALSDTAGFFAASKALFEDRFISERNIFLALIKRLSAKGLKISSAESCTGGLFSAKLAECEGASKVLVGGFCAYSRAAKKTWLGVTSLKDAAVYSPECAQELASGALAKSGANIAVGITGVLGASSDCGVASGHVQICALLKSGISKSVELNLSASRALMQEQSCICAAALCLELISQNEAK